MSTSIINHLTWFQDINLAAAKSTLISRNQVYLQCILPPRVHLQWLIHSQGAVMHMPVNKPNVNCTYDSSHGTDEIYPKGPPHIYIYISLSLSLCVFVYVYIYIDLHGMHILNMWDINIISHMFWYHCYWLLNPMQSPFFFLGGKSPHIENSMLGAISSPTWKVQPWFINCGGTPPIVIIWYLNGTLPIKQPRGLLIQGWHYIYIHICTMCVCACLTVDWTKMCMGTINIYYDLIYTLDLKMGPITTSVHQNLHKSSGIPWAR